MDNKSIQAALIKQRLLDPPADGSWGNQSKLALKLFQERNNLTTTGEPDSKILTLLSVAPEPQIHCGSDFAGRIIKYMLDRGDYVPVGDRLCTIVYTEGCNADGSVNTDTQNQWNDRRIVIEIPDGRPKIVGNWLATSEPGNKYTRAPLNSLGAFRIAFGQYKAWRVGIHKDHEALVQCGEVKGYRDSNKDGMRTGDPVVVGSGFGVNQHWGYDMAQVDGASAGCLVGQSKAGHREFMALIKQDKRYQASSGYTFMTAAIAGDKLP